VVASTLKFFFKRLVLGHKPQATGRKLQAASHERQAINTLANQQINSFPNQISGYFEAPASELKHIQALCADLAFQSFKPQASSHKLQATSFKPQASSHKRQAINILANQQINSFPNQISGYFEAPASE